MREGHRDADNLLKMNRFFERLAQRVTLGSGSTWAFVLACAVVIIWLLTGPLFHFSDTWQLVINTGTTIVTFLMVFLVQRTQTKDALAIHLKLNEIVAALKGASNRLIDAEELCEAEVQALHERYQALKKRAEKGKDVRKSLSIETDVCEPQ
jgi:low affinity Fe/Cu permease